MLALALAAAAESAWPLDLAREDVRAFAAEMRDKHGFDAAWLDAVLADAAIQPRIIELMTQAGRGSDALARLPQPLPDRPSASTPASPSGASTGRTSTASRRRDGVAPHVIVGIIGCETFFGRITGKFRVVDALSTLAFDYPPRASYFRAELEQFLLLAREEQFDTKAVLGSYAGAMGNGQFMPRSYRTWAVDGDGDGKRDLWGSWPDVIASVANYLADHGWRAGEPVVVPASLWFPDGGGLVAGKLAPDSTVKSLRDRGLAFETTQGAKAPALFIKVDGDDAPELRAGFHNFGVITRYNRSILYALAVNDLGRRIESLRAARRRRRPRRGVGTMRLHSRTACALALLALAGCAREPLRPAPPPAPVTPAAGAGVARVRACRATSRARSTATRRSTRSAASATSCCRSAAGYIEQGVASWYGPDFHGGRTATGETYDMHAMTGAHPTLPLPTWVRVTNLENGRSVVVRLNDRGPFARGRIIDLSRAAAEELDMVRAGTARVEVASLAPAAPPAAAPQLRPPPTTPRPAPSAAGRTPRPSPSACATPGSPA